MLAIGGWQPRHAHSEVMDAELEWTTIDDYPYSGGEYINEVAPIYHENNYYVFGNYGEETDTNIGRLSCSTWTWDLIGHLKVIVDWLIFNFSRITQIGRGSHGVIYTQSAFLMIGGAGTRQSEHCLLDGDSVTCTAQDPELTDYYYYPRLVFVEENFCKNQLV